MIGKLRRKLILTTVLSLVLIFAVMVAAINIISNYSSQQQISTSLEMLAGKYTNAAELLDPEPESGKAPRPEIPASKLARDKKLLHHTIGSQWRAARMEE